MKTKEELEALKEEVKALNKKLMDLNDEELAQVTGGLAPGRNYWRNHIKDKRDTTRDEGKNE